MKTGVVVPQFRDTPDTALQMVDAAEDSDIDGVFVTDHLWWPFGDGRGVSQSALSLMAAMAARTTRLNVGSLVVRVGVNTNKLLLSQLLTIAEIADGRFIAGLGVGDKLSEPENVAYGVPTLPREARLELLEELAVGLQDAGVTVWLGGKSQAIRDVAERIGAVVNQWNAGHGALWPTDTWGGEFEDELQVRDLADGDVPWAVFLVPGCGKDPVGAVSKLHSAVSAD